MADRPALAARLGWLTTHSASNAALLVSLCVTLFVLSFNSVMYDDREPMLITNVRVISRVMAPGDKFVYEFDYTKRPECYPPDGRGEVQYRYWLDDGNGFERYVWIDPETISYAVPAEHHRTTKIEMPVLKPGLYMMQWRARFYCKGASKIFERDGPMMPFEIK